MNFNPFNVIYFEPQQAKELFKVRLDKLNRLEQEQLQATMPSSSSSSSSSSSTW